MLNFYPIAVALVLRPCLMNLARVGRKIVPGVVRNASTFIALCADRLSRIMWVPAALLDDLGQEGTNS
jgi:hypothetical protein